VIKTNNVLDLFKRTTTKRRYIREIDGLRLFAIIPVLFQHLSERLIKYAPGQTSAEWSNTDLAYVLSRGTMGVYLFFVVSGFILCIPFAKAHLYNGNRTTYSNYLVRRISRLEPPYIIWMLFFFVVLLIAGELSFSDGLSHFFASILYLHNFVFNEYSIINPVAWSLEVEFQFYLLAPLIALIYFKATNEIIRRAIMVLLLIMIPILQGLFGFNEMPWKASFIGQSQHFLLGFLLADLFLTKKPFFLKKDFTWDLIATISFSVMLFTWSNEWYKELIFSVCSALFFIAAFKGQTFNKILNQPITYLIGGMCYTIYLMHLPFLELVVSKTQIYLQPGSYWLTFLVYAVMLIPVTLLISAIFYLALEKPFMKKNWWKIKATASSIIDLTHNSVSYHLNKTRNHTLLITFMLLGSTNLLSQNLLLSDPNLLQGDQEKWIKQNDYLKLLSVDELVNKAVSSSPLMLAQEVRISNHQKDVMLINRRWLDYISVGGTYFYGSSSFLDAVETVGLTDYSVTNRKNAIANVHVSARIPISEIFTRQTEKDKVLNEIALEELNKDVIERSIRQAIVIEYQKVLAKTSILKIKSKELESLRLASKLAEEYLLQGNIDLSEYTAAVSKLSKVEQELANLQYEAQLAYATLLEIVGQPIEKGRN